jgi:ribosomal protein S18 acetylase RimI-like enzyme
VKITREFCDAYERREISGFDNCVDGARARFPELEADTLPVGGGIAVFLGTQMPISEAICVGLWQSAGTDEVDALLTFYGERGMKPRVQVTPYTDKTFVRALIDRGFVPLDYEHPMTADLYAIGAERDPRVTEMADLMEWSREIGSAFKDGAPSDARDLLIGQLVAGAPATTALEVRVDGAIAAGGCMGVHGDFCGFFGAGTLPRYRRQGFQSALVLDRAARGIEAGARYGRVTARPGTISEQNFRRIGFVPLYTRTLWGIP